MNIERCVRRIRNWFNGYDVDGHCLHAGPCPRFDEWHSPPHDPITGRY